MVAMSRLRCKTPIHGIMTVASEKWDKRVASRRLHRMVRERIKEDPDAQVSPLKHEVSDVWDTGKDGKRWFDAVQFSQLMRK
jgi:hypothetical protein